MNNAADWKPKASLDALQQRAALYSEIRTFFAHRNVLEVDTQLLSQGTITDPHIDAFVTTFEYASSGQSQDLYLQTSPEYAMKRLAAAYGCSIYQLSKAFRHEGFGRWHNPEFTLLEWYSMGVDHHKLMDEVAALLAQVLDLEKTQRLTYQSAFLQYLELDPLIASTPEIADVFERSGINLSNEKPIDHDGMLQLLFSCVIEPNLGKEHPCFIYSYPASQSSLAKLNAQDPRVADRFELFYKGAELANGFNELQDVSELERRFDHENRLRRTFRLQEKPLDKRFLAAMEKGLPECSGVAMGIDRLLMLKHSYSHMQDVIAFPITNA